MNEQILDNQEYCEDENCMCCNDIISSIDDYNYFYLIIDGAEIYQISKQDYEKINNLKENGSITVNAIENTSINSPGKKILIDKDTNYILSMSLTNEPPTDFELELYKEANKIRIESKNKSYEY